VSLSLGGCCVSCLPVYLCHVGLFTVTTYASSTFLTCFYFEQFFNWHFQQIKKDKNCFLALGAASFVSAAEAKPLLAGHPRFAQNAHGCIIHPPIYWVLMGILVQMVMMLALGMLLPPSPGPAAGRTPGPRVGRCISTPQDLLAPCWQGCFMEN